MENKQSDETINVQYDFKSTVKIGEYVKVENNGWNKTNPASIFGGIEKVKSHIDSAKTPANDDIWIWN
ncbi:hypothetical protein ACQKD9_26580 [Bacillus paramycoides]|uniref:hypothetical protein n=1 Tax=Bacillus paramycoides TaxID=2026194 RepID=UPI003D07BEB9